MQIHEHACDNCRSLRRCDDWECVKRLVGKVSRRIVERNCQRCRCANCGATLTTADRDEGMCTQCGDGIEGDSDAK